MMTLAVDRREETVAGEIVPADRSLASRCDTGRGLTRGQAVDRGVGTFERIRKSFSSWLGEDVETLRVLADMARDGAGDRSANEKALIVAAVNLKGAAATYGFPLISRYADLLCVFLEKAEIDGERRGLAVENYVNAILTVHRMDLRSDQSALTRELTAKLLALTQKYA